MRTSTVVSLLWTSATLVAAASSKDFTVDDLISAPRPQPPIPDDKGTQAISVVDEWDPKDDKTTRTVYLVALDTKGKEPVELFSCPPGQAGEFFWLSDDTAAYLNGSTLYSFETEVSTQAVRRRHVLDFPEGISASGLQYDSKSGHLGFTAQVWQHGDGSFESVEKLNEKFEGRGDTGQVYDDLFIRHWDTWRVPGKVWTVGLTKIYKGINGFADKPKVFLNLLNDTGLYNQMDPPSFALSASHLAVSVKAPHLNNAMHTREDVYVTDLSHLHAIKPSHLTPHGHGAISGLTFSPDGSKLSWLEMAEDGYESDRRVAVVHDTKEAIRWTDTWDRSPSSITWSLDSESLYLLAEHEGRVLPYHLSEPGHLPSPLIFNHTTTSISALHNQLLLSISSHTSPIDYFLLPDSADTEAAKLHRLTSFSDKHTDGRLDGLEGEEFWFTGDSGWKVMGWANKPPGWKAGEKRKWPMAFLIHGGPQGAWEDSWSTRWSQAMFAAKGYFVIAINPTGSTGYGQEFTDRIQGEWGSRPYRDLVAGYQAALDLYPEIDPDRTAALGASYGGYMINWLNGHNPGFKAMICHDGIFSTTDAFFTTEELWFPLHDNMGSPLDNRLLYEKWNPMNHVAEWSTPTLVIHSGKDFRLIEGAGIAAFTALQYQGVPSRFLYFPDENHWVLKPGNSRRWHHEVFKWLDEWVGHGKRDAAGDAALVIQA